MKNNKKYALVVVVSVLANVPTAMSVPVVPNFTQKLLIQLIIVQDGNTQ